MKEIISRIIKKNKGFSKDPSFVFKISVAMAIVFLLFNGAISEPNKNAIQILKPEISETFIQDQEEVFFKSLPIVKESSALLISQYSIIYSLSPLYHPDVQVLGALGFPEREEREIISYTVRAGDNLDTIASHFGISRETIVWANELNRSIIRPGQELIILPVSGVFHIVEKGDIIERIAERYEAESGDIIVFNNLDEERINIGDIFVIPGGKMPAPVVVPATRIPFSPLSSWLIPPARGIITQGFHWYNAVDIANNCGTRIYASATGEIQMTGYHSIAGNFIRILHPNGLITFYGHLSRILASKGQPVSQGDVIGYMGNTGHTIGPTGCHIHFEVRGGKNPFLSYPLNHKF